MKIKLFILIGIFHLNLSNGKSCSIVCDLPSTLDENTFILEGEIIGYIGGFESSYVHGSFGYVQLLVTKHIYAETKYDTIYFASLSIDDNCRNSGLEKSDLEKYYPLGKSYSIVAKKLNHESFKNAKSNFLQKTYCLPSVSRKTLKNRRKYNFEIHYKMYSYLIDNYPTNDTVTDNSNIRRKIKKEIKKMNKFATKKKGDEKWKDYEPEKGHEPTDFQKRMRIYEIKKQFYIPSTFQAYLTLAKLKQTKLKRKRFKLLEKLIWSRSVYDNSNFKFIEEQNISEEQKEILRKKYKEREKY